MLPVVNFFPIKKRNIGAGAQDAAKAFLVAAGSVCRSQKVAINTDVGLWEKRAQRVGNDLVPVGTGTACAKKVDLCYLRGVGQQIGYLLLEYF
jgi:hypothetical protein